MRKLLPLMLACGLIAAQVQVHAQKKTDDGLPPVQPPPAMDEPSASTSQTSPATNKTKTVPIANSDAESKAAAEEAKRRAAQPVPALPPEPEKKFDSPGLPPDVQKAAEATELPVVTVRQNGNERVEGYRKKGILYFVRVVTPEGPPRYYVDNRSEIPADIRQLSGPSGHVEPVYFKLFEWK